MWLAFVGAVLCKHANSAAVHVLQACRFSHNAHRLLNQSWFPSQRGIRIILAGPVKVEFCAASWRSSCSRSNLIMQAPVLTGQLCGSVSTSKSVGRSSKESCARREASGEANSTGEHQQGHAAAAVQPARRAGPGPQASSTGVHYTLYGLNRLKPSAAVLTIMPLICRGGRVGGC